MAVDISSGQLKWVADIDLSTAEKKAAELRKLLAEAANVAISDRLDAQIKKSAESAKALTEQVIKTEQIQSKVVGNVTIEVQKIKQQVEVQEEFNKELDKSIGKYKNLTNQTSGGKASVPYQFGSPVKSPQLDSTTQKTLNDLKETFKGIEPEQQKYIQMLVQMQVEEKQLAATKKQIQQAYNEEKITLKQYEQAMQGAAAKQLELAETKQFLTQKQKEYNAQLGIEETSITQLKLQLSGLIAEYESLTIAERKSERGVNLSNSIKNVKSQVKEANAGITEVVKTSEKAGKGVAGLFSKAFGSIRQLAYLIPGIGIAGIFGAIFDAIGSVVSELINFDNVADKVTKDWRDATKAANQEIGKQVGEINALVAATQNLNLPLKERRDATARLVEINKENNERTGEHNKLLVEQNGVLSANKTGIDNLTESLVQQAKTKAYLNVLEKAYAQIIDAQTATLNESTSGFKDYLNYLLGFVKDGIAGGIKETAQGQKKAYDENIKNAQDYYDRVFKLFQDGLKAGDLTLSGVFNTTKKQQEGESKYLSLLQKRKEMLENISKLERDAFQTGLIKKSSEIDNINQKYDEQIKALQKLNEQLAQYNKTSKGRDVPLIGQSEINRINAARNLELQNFQYKEDTENYIESLKQKEAAFNALKEAQERGNTELSDKTREIYQDQVGQYKDYLSMLKTEATNIIARILSGQVKGGDLLKLNSLTDLIKQVEPKSDTERKAETLKEYNELLAATQTYEVKRLAIIRKYAKLEETLRNNSSNLSPEQRTKRQQQLEKDREDELESLANDLLMEDTVYRRYYDNREKLSKKATDSVILHLEKEREKVEEGTDAYNALTNAINAARSESKQKGDVGFVNGLRETASIISSVFSDVTIQLNKNLNITGQQISQLANNIANLFDSNSSKGSQVGSIIGIITFAITTIRDGLLTANDLATNLDASKQTFEELTLILQAQNTQLERQQELVDGLYGKDRVVATVDFYNNIKKQEENLLKDLKELQLEVIKSQKEVFIDPIFNTELSNSGFTGIWTQLATGGSAKTKLKVELEAIDTSNFSTIDDFIKLMDEIQANGGKLDGKVVVEDDIKALQALIDNYNSLQEKSEQLKEQLQQLFTGTTSSQIADTIIEGLRQGKRASKDFADNFEDLMREAILNSIKIQTLEKPMQAFYEEFAQFSASDGILTPEEISQLRQDYNDLIEAAGEQFDALQQITKINLSQSTNEANSLTGAIKGMTEEQATLLAGQFGGLRITAMEQLNVARQGLTAWLNIENNTFNTVLRMETLLRKFDAYESGLSVINVKIK